MKKFKFRHPTDRLLIFILTITIGLMAAIMMFFGWQINLLNDELRGYGNLKEQQQTGLAFFPIKTLVASAVSNLYSLQPVTDPLTQRVYIPEARIYLPLSDDSRNLVYSHQPADSRSPAQFSFNTKQNIGMLMSDWDEVPCIQRIAGFSIDQNQYDQEGKSAGSIKLADGRTLYLFKNSAVCQRPGYDPAGLINLLKQAKSY